MSQHRILGHTRCVRAIGVGRGPTTVSKPRRRRKLVAVQAPSLPSPTLTRGGGVKKGVVLALLVSSAALAQDRAPYQVGDQRSGYTYLTPTLQAQQNDELGNQGMLWVERGAAIWKAVAGSASKSCASCHSDA